MFGSKYSSNDWNPDWRRQEPEPNSYSFRDQYTSLPLTLELLERNTSTTFKEFLKGGWKTSFYTLKTSLFKSAYTLPSKQI